jgi:mRNA interferase MazF
VPYQAGDILLADLDPVAGHEQGGRRPVLVLSGPSYNELRNEQLIVAAITSRQRDWSRTRSGSRATPAR